MDHEQPTPAFAGFSPANTTPVPDVLFDELLIKLSGNELRVMLYIMRRTFGFKKTEDGISLSQFTDGIVTRDKKRLDWGCGIRKRSTVCNVLNKLIDDGYIEKVKSKTNDGDNGVTTYKIRFQEVGPKTPLPGDQTAPTVGPKQPLPRRAKNAPTGRAKNGPHNKQSTRNSNVQETELQVVVGESDLTPSEETTTTPSSLEDTLSFPLVTPEVEKLAISCARITGMPLNKDMQTLIAEFADRPIEAVSRNMMDFVLADPTNRYASLALLRHSLEHERDHPHDGKKEKTSRGGQRPSAPPVRDEATLEKERAEADEYNKTQLEKLRNMTPNLGIRQRKEARGVAWQ